MNGHRMFEPVQALAVAKGRQDVPNGRRAELPVFIQFAFKDDGRGPAESVRRQHMTSDSRVKDVGEIKTEHLFDIVVDLKPPLNIGSGPFGQRTLFGADGGSFEGPRLRGDVLAGGGDWALFRPDGAMTLDVRLALRTHDDALVHMTYGGRWTTPPELWADLADPVKRHQIDPAGYYFRTNPLFETGAKHYAWLNDIVCVGSGYLIEGGIAYKVSQVM